MRLRRTLVIALAAGSLVATATVAGYADHFSTATLVCRGQDASSCGELMGITLMGVPTVDRPPVVAFLANGRVPADALAAGPIAAALGAPVFTTEADRLPTPALDGLKKFNPHLIIVVGGPNAVSDAVVQSLSSGTGLPYVIGTPRPGTHGIVRVAGDDRFATAEAVSDLLLVFDPYYLPTNTIAKAAELASQADTAEHADAADVAATATTVEGLLPFHLTLNDGDDVLVAELGSISIRASCTDTLGDVEVALYAATDVDGAFSTGGIPHSGNGDNLDTDTLPADAQILALNDMMEKVANDTGDGFVASADFDWLGVDGETTMLGVNVLGSDCVAAGVVHAVPAPVTP